MTTTPAPTDHDLDTLKALEQAATAGPWRVADSLPSPSVRTERGTEIVYNPWGSKNDLNFIAAARNALPALLDELAELAYELSQVHEDNQRLSGELAKVRAELDELQAAPVYANEQLAIARNAAPEASPATAAEPAHTVWDHYGPCGYCGVTSGPCLNPDRTAPWTTERMVPAPKPHPRRQLVDTTAEAADEPKATCHLPVQNGEPCGLLTCRKNGCRVTLDAEPARTYRDMPVVKCHLVDRDLSHMAHVFDDDERGEKVVCSGLLPHSVPLDAEPDATPAQVRP